MTNRECKLTLRRRALAKGSLAAPSANIRRRIAVKSEPVAISARKTVDKHCEENDDDRGCRTKRMENIIKNNAHNPDDQSEEI